MSKSGPRDIRRIVAANDPDDNAVIFSDATNTDVRADPARPGFASNRIWVTEGTPAPVAGVKETLDLPHTLEPPKNGSVCRVVTHPPEANWEGKVGPKDVAAYFESMGSPGASTYSPTAPHPYMQKTETLDFCFVLEGEIDLILDTGTVSLKAMDVVVQRGTSHAWRNRSASPCRMAVASHGGSY